MKKPPPLLLASAWLVLPLACHLGFSWIGFCPTDDGWLQAVARRLAEGEVPHRDFIFVRPALSAYLQVPLVWWGGDHVIWLSRLWGWLTLGAVCWIWSGLIRVEVPGGPPFVRWVLYALALLFCAHTFPIMAWHSIDGMLLCSVAVVLAARDTPNARRWAFIAAGTAALCRQNLALFAPLLLFATGRPWREWLPAGFYSALPVLLYAAGIAMAGGFSDFVEQVWAAHAAFDDVALMRFAKEGGFWGGLTAGALIGVWLARFGRAEGKWRRWLPLSLFLLSGGHLLATLWLAPASYHLASFVTFGSALGLALPVLIRDDDAHDRLTLITGLGLAWTTAISIGYNNPALASGVLLLLIWRRLHRLAPNAVNPLPLLALLLAGVAVAFSNARRDLPYGDRPVQDLRFEAGEVLPGAAVLRTNLLTYLTLEDLRRITGAIQARGNQYAVFSDLSAHWIRSPQRNPLPCDWPQETELGYNQKLFHRLFGELRKMPPSARIVVQKYLISEYSWHVAPVPPDWSYYYPQRWIRENCAKVGETEFFEIYLPPASPEGPRN